MTITPMFFEQIEKIENAPLAVTLGVNAEMDFFTPKSECTAHGYSSL